MSIMKKSLSTFLGILALCQLANAQLIYERHTNEVYNFLSRFAQKGYIEFNDNIRPLGKNYIKSMLDSLGVRSMELSGTEKKELAFYEQEYTPDIRKRVMSARDNDFRVEGDPVGTLAYQGGSGKSIVQTGIGGNFWGSFGKHWGFQLSVESLNLSGTGLDTGYYKTLAAGAATGPVLINAFTKNSQNYLDLRGHISYSFKNGSISVGQDYLLWGYGESGRIVLSDKAPTYPYIRLDLQPLPWLRFNYVHAWLQSGLVDSSQSYTIPSGINGGIRQVDIQKFMAQHSLEFRLKRGLFFTLGESVIYNDNLNIGYLIPIMFFKAVDQITGARSIDRGSNGQFFFQLLSRNQIKNTQLFATLFVDEIKTSAIFNKTKQRNQLGYTVGISRTDIGGIRYLTLGAEYTRIRPFVYRNFLPGQDYSQAGYALGDWMGNNADRLCVFAKYTPLPRLKLQAQYSHLRKGGAGTLDQQYNQQPQPPFLFDFQGRSDEVIVGASYEYVHRMCFNLNYRRFDQLKTMNIGVTYGL